MKTIIESISKLAYSTPSIVKIVLDNEISLALQSDPSGGPGFTPPGDPISMNFKNDPFSNTNV
jgi:hypothetical protein